MEGWNVYMAIQQLYEQGFKITQIARKVGVSRTTVYTYLNRTPQDMHVWLASTQERTKKLASYDNEILSWLRKHQDMSAAQVLDWLREKYGEINVADSTVRSHVSRLRKHYQVPKVTAVRQYEAIPDPPMGQQAQVDFGHTKQTTTNGGEIPLHFISFVLSHARYKVVIWLDRPFPRRMWYVPMRPRSSSSAACPKKWYMTKMPSCLSKRMPGTVSIPLSLKPTGKKGNFLCACVVKPTLNPKDGLKMSSGL